MGLFGRKKDKDAGVTGGADGGAPRGAVLGRGLVSGVQLTGSSLTTGAITKLGCVIQLTVYADGMEPFAASAKTRVVEWQIPQLANAAVAVRVDPSRPDKAEIDWDTPAPVVRMARPTQGGAEEVLARGMPAEVVLVQNAPLGILNWKGEEMHAFVLTVMVDGHQPWQAQVGNALPPDQLPKVFPGSRLPAKVLSVNSNDVVIDWDAARGAG